MMSAINLISKDALWAQWKQLKTALDQTEAMLRAIGELIPRTVEDGRELSLTKRVQKLCDAAEEEFTGSMICERLQQEYPGYEFDPGSVSALLSAAVTKGDIEVTGKVPNSKANTYRAKPKVELSQF